MPQQAKPKPAAPFEARACRRRRLQALPRRGIWGDRDGRHREGGGCLQGHGLQLLRGQVVALRRRDGADVRRDRRTSSAGRARRDLAGRDSAGRRPIFWRACWRRFAARSSSASWPSRGSSRSWARSSGRPGQGESRPSWPVISRTRRAEAFSTSTTPPARPRASSGSSRGSISSRCSPASASDPRRRRSAVGWTTSSPGSWRPGDRGPEPRGPETATEISSGACGSKPLPSTPAGTSTRPPGPSRLRSTCPRRSSTAPPPRCSTDTSTRAREIRCSHAWSRRSRRSREAPRRWPSPRGWRRGVRTCNRSPTRATSSSTTTSITASGSSVPKCSSAGDARPSSWTCATWPRCATRSDPTHGWSGWRLRPIR